LQGFVLSDHAVFFDPTRRRWGWIKRISTVLGLLCVVVVSLFLISLSSTPFLPKMPGLTEEIQRTFRRAVRLQRHQSKLQQFIARREREKLFAQIVHDNRVYHERAARPPIKGGPIVAAFYAPWQETGLHSLVANAPQMTHVLPAWVHLLPDARGLDFRDWDPVTVPHNADVIKTARENNLNIVPVFSNAQQSDFDPKRVHLFLTSPVLQEVLIRQLHTWVLNNGFHGLNVDFENLQLADYPLLIPFLQRLKSEFARDHLLVSADLEASRWQYLDWKQVAQICDFVVVMAYDEHGSGAEAGPIASINWYRDVLLRAVRTIPREKLVIGLGNYAYDWMEGRDWAEPLTYQGALVLASTFHPGQPAEQVVDFDPDALNPTFLYVDDGGREHEVWMLDAITAANQWSLAQTYGVRGAAVWVLGSADPTIWKFLDRARLMQPIDRTALREIKFPYDVEFIGEGEISYVKSNPTDGRRELEIDPKTGLLVDESYHSFPTSYVIQRSGYDPNKIALTVDDGPASPYTAQMLDELKKLNVKATFFLIGENADRYPGLVRRIWAEGHEIGNHTYTHGNMGTMRVQRAEFELNATQRVFQSLLHRSTLLFRPPYNADAEPTTPEEVQPLVLASRQNYITVLEFVDPQDWKEEERSPIDGTLHKRTAEDMLKTVLEQIDVEHGSCILLHDGGGDRSETVKLIPLLVNELRRRGKTIVPVSDLIGSTRDKVNPPVKSTDTLMLASDRIVFEAMYVVEVFLGIAFITAIILGTLRVIFISALALIERYRSRRAREEFDPAFAPPVSVVIAAYNEAKVIARTLHAVLGSDYAGPLEVVVIDDGSADDTAGEVERQFADEPRVKLLRQENAGKAAALNRGIATAEGEIIIALDADTIFARDTIAKLVRRFREPLVGAVAGNVKVGNRINPLTYWQFIEYVTSQNLDRRAYSLINSVSVVPGAVGAWRRDAILQAGGYTTDTMAEDMDLTWRIRRIGWRVATETEAIGFTEAPDSFRNLFKQRFRWAFGTLQCLWKHRRALGRYGWFGRVMLPSLWLFQIAFQALSPLVDLQIAWGLASVIQSWHRGGLTQDWQPLPQAVASLYLIALMYAFFFVIELIGSAIAFKLDREDPKVLVWLFWQRFLYRQLMYAVLLKSLKTAISGIRAGWGKLERKGTVELVAE
jgi:cellulose synthase/poly-beta-1,6-N-acetylglucosamine synthase-like glycosyltransferase/spore germination protein YaaH/peptidoglycan/xylan/chitin deacetylase (PgdA/CDA1 family)